MYLHIGNNILINTEELIGIFDVESLKKGKNFFYSYNSLKNNNKIIDISEGKEKSYILLKREEEIIIYISNISSVTLSKRINEKDYY